MGAEGAGGGGKGVDRAARAVHGRDMDLDFPIRTQGRAPKPVLSTIVRELTQADLAAIDQSLGSVAPAVKSIRASHHRLAKALATGMKPGEAALACGYSLSRVSILQSDSTFRDLVEFYRGAETQAFRDTQAELLELSNVGIEVLKEKIEEGELSDKELVDVTFKALDRAGFGPATKSTQVNVNVDLSARLDAARRRAGLIEGKALELPSSEEPAA